MRSGLAAPALLAVLTTTGVVSAQSSPPPLPTAPRPAASASRVTWPQLTGPVPVAYPAGETRSSRVVLALTIGPDGRVHGVEVLESGGERFDEAAVEAAGRFVFDPAVIDGHPVAVKIKYTCTFTPPVPAAAPAPVPAPGPTPTSAPAPEAPVEDVEIRGARKKRDETGVTVAAAQAGKVVGTEGDPIKVLEDLPGVSRPSFGSGLLVFWGSTPTESRTYVDGVEVPALFHGGALRSTVNGDLVRDVTLVPGAYGADYGNAIGGMVRVDTKDLPASGVHGYAAADTLDGSAMATAAVGDRVRVGVAGRYGWLDGVLRAVDAPSVDEFFAIPRYSDYQAKAQIRLRERESVDVVFLASNDSLTQTIPSVGQSLVRSETTETDYQRLYLHYRYLDDAGGAVDITPWVGHDTNDLDAVFGENPASVDESTWRWGARASHRSRIAPPVAMTLGVDVEGSSASVFRDGSLLIPPREGDITVFGQPPGDSTSADTWSAGFIDVAPYVTADLDLGPLSLSPGLRVDGYLMQTSRQTPRVGATPSIGYEQLVGELGPRVAARLQVTPRLAILGAAGLYSQPPDPADLSAVFGNPKLGPETADHASFGEALRVTPTLSLEVVGFYKWMQDLAVRDPSPTPQLAQALLQEGVGRAYGVQMLLRQEPWHGLFGWVAYTISRSERQDTPGAGWRLLDYDQPHVLTVVASKELGAWTIGARFRFASGLPRTPVTGSFYDATDDVYQPIFGPQNSIRLPDFWQLDVRVDRSFRLGQAARLLVYVEGLNVTNHQNGEEYIYSVDYSQRGTITGLPAVGVLGARVEL